MPAKSHFEPVETGATEHSAPEVLEQLGKNGSAMKYRKVKLALATNPKTPTGVAIVLITRLVDFDLKMLLKDKNVSETVRREAKKIKPGIKISAAVFNNWAADRDGVGQDWKLWCEKGYVDFVCPMDYTPSNGSFENMVVKQVQWANGARCSSRGCW